MTVAAAPAAPQRDAVVAWDRLYASLEGDLEKWAVRISNGQTPLTPGEAQQVRSLINGIRALLKADETTAQMSAVILNRASMTAKASLDAALAAMGPQALAAAEEVAGLVGMDAVPNVRAVQAIVNLNVGQLTSDYVRLSTDQQMRLVQELAKGVVKGQGPRKVAKSLKGIVEEWSASGQARAVMIARTDLARAYDLSSQVVYLDAQAKGLIKGWRWVAHGKNPCDICRDLDGRMFPAEADTYRHPNCTCTTVPVLANEVSGPEGAPKDLELVAAHSGWVSWRKVKSVAK